MCRRARRHMTFGIDFSATDKCLLEKDGQPRGDGGPYTSCITTSPACIRRCGERRPWRRASPTMSGPSKKSSPSSGESEPLLVYVRRLRLHAEEFQRTVEEEL